MRPLVTPEGEPRPETRVPLYGAVEIALEEVGAVVAGALGSLEPAAPGVAVLEIHDGADGPISDLILRLGSEANRRDVVRFDGAFTALYVRRIESSGFAGRWASGVPGEEPAGGHFCAVRVPA